MTDASSALQKLLHLEQDAGLYDYEINSVKLWNIFRFSYRYRYVSKTSGIEQITNKESKLKRFILIVVNSFVSFWSLLCACIRSNKFENIIIPFGRLQMNNGELFDKFTDPVIDEATIKSRVCIFQLPGNNSYRHLRRHEDIIITLDAVYCLAYAFLPFYAFVYFLNGDFNVTNHLYKRASSIFPMYKRDLFRMHVNYLLLIILGGLYSLLFRRFQVKRLFGVGRISFASAIYGAHKNHIPVYEFQHGVTMGETEYYSGPGCNMLDPDYFLAFGSLWNGPQFGISPQKIINIGWAYKNEVKSSSEPIIPNSVLLISSPNITIPILQTAVELSQLYPQFDFYIRCHPYEKYTEEQLAIVDGIDNLHMSDNSVDSRIALGSYMYVLGENSSVVYEALSLGKKVGRICYNGIDSIRLDETKDDGFFYLNEPAAFSAFVDSKAQNADEQAYSDFDVNFLEHLPE